MVGWPSEVQDSQLNLNQINGTFHLKFRFDWAPCIRSGNSTCKAQDRAPQQGIIQAKQTIALTIGQLTHREKIKYIFILIFGKIQVHFSSKQLVLNGYH